MLVRKMFELVLSQAELKEAILGQVEVEMNDFVAGTPEWKRLYNIIAFLRSSKNVMMDWEDDNLVLSHDGVFETENLV